MVIMAHYAIDVSCKYEADTTNGYQLQDDTTRPVLNHYGEVLFYMYYVSEISEFFMTSGNTGSGKVHWKTTEKCL